MESAGGDQEVAGAVGDEDYNLGIAAYPARIAFTAIVDRVLAG
jgi:hypothetical protein